MIELKLKKIIILIDFGIIIFTLLFFLYNIRPFLYLFLRYNYDGGFNLNNANIFGVLFLITLLKSIVGIICILIFKIKYKQKLYGKDFKIYTLLWILFSIMILSYSLVLIIMKAYNSIYNLIYAIFIIIGTFCWIKTMLNNIYIKNYIKNIFVLFNILSNYLLIVMGYFISIY
jgi:hypothetical protein